MKKTLKFIMVLLIGSVIFRILILTAVALPVIFANPTKALGGAEGVTKASWESSIRFGSLELTRSFKVDSSGRAVGPTGFIGTQHMKPAMLINGEPVVEGPQGEMLEARHVPGSTGIQVPVSQRYFRVAAILAVTLMILLSGWMALVAVQLYRFANAAEAGQFFTDANRKRLRIMGSFLLLMGLLPFLFSLSIPWIITRTTGIRGFIPDFNFDAVPAFPYALVMGLLMFIMAEAFTKGEVLRSENELTI